RLVSSVRLALGASLDGSLHKEPERRLSSRGNRSAPSAGTLAGVTGACWPDGGGRALATVGRGHFDSTTPCRTTCLAAASQRAASYSFSGPFSGSSNWRLTASSPGPR